MNGNGRYAPTYGLRQSVAPTKEPVTADDVMKLGLVPNGIESDLINSFARAARQLCEHFTGRQFITATWEMTLDRFPPWEIALPEPPWQSVTSVVYLDLAGATQTLSAASYRFETVRGRLTPAYATYWPSAYQVSNAVTITYQSGYGTTPDTVPDGIRTAIKMCVLDWLENRRGIYQLPNGVRDLLMDFWTGKWAMAC